MRLFEAKNLTKKYDKTVLNHLDFSIDEGEVVGIIGVSGCGKSTLARLVSGIEKPSSGSLLYQGKTVDFKKSRKDIQLILQNSIESFSPRMKIRVFLYEPYHYFYHLHKNLSSSESKSDLFYWEHHVPSRSPTFRLYIPQP